MTSEWATSTSWAGRTDFLLPCAMCSWLTQENGLDRVQVIVCFNPQVTGGKQRDNVRARQGLRNAFFYIQRLQPIQIRVNKFQGD